MPRHDLDDLNVRDPKLIGLLVDRLEPILERWFRPTVHGLERLSGEPVLYVGNHSGSIMTPDSWILGAALFRARGVEALPYGLAHEIALGLPWINDKLMRVGAVRASHQNAHRLFARGDSVIVYPGGDVDAVRPWTQRNEVIFGGRQGYIRLAISAGVPIVPVVSAGSHSGFIVLRRGERLARRLHAHRWMRAKVWPVVLSVPWGLTVGPPIPYLPVPTRVLVDVLPPMRFGPDADVDAADRAVRNAMNRSIRDLAAKRGQQPSALRAFFGSARPV